jgi:hypothetical protein
MQLARILSLVAVVTVSASTTAIVSCSNGDVRHNTDAPGGSNHSDGSNTMMIDAPGSGSMGSGNALGITCTPGTGSDTQGSCPAGFDCLNLQGGTNAWCSNKCTQGAGDMCHVGYTGPGKALCILGVTSGSGSGSATSYCDVICEDDTGNGGLCGAGTTCNGTCPGTLACKGAITNQNGSAVGKACE